MREHALLRSVITYCSAESLSTDKPLPQVKHRLKKADVKTKVKARVTCLHSYHMLLWRWGLASDVRPTRHR